MKTVFRKNIDSREIELAPLKDAVYNRPTALCANKTSTVTNKMLSVVNSGDTTEERSLSLSRPSILQNRL